MSNNTYVVIFPSLFAENKITLLMTNIKKILKNHSENFTKISRDGKLILVDANDPVLASSTIGLLFGIRKIVIAKQIQNDFKSVVNEITRIGSSLLLKGEKFYVNVEGTPKGYVIKDVELSATSSLIDKNKKVNASPGTKENHDKLLFTYITKSNAYVSIFNDKGLGGAVNNSQNEKIICGVFDEFSAITCLEAIKQGFEVKIIIFYIKHSKLVNILKILHKILPRTLQIKTKIEFYKISNLDDNLLVKNFIITDILSKIAISEKISCISLNISPLFFPSKIIKELKLRVFNAGLIPIIPLYGIDSGIFDNAKEIGLEKYIPKIEKLLQTKIPSNKKIKIQNKDVDDVLKNKKTIAVKSDSNMIHAILDSLE